MFKLFSKGDQLKAKLAKLKFSEIGDGRLFLVFGRRLVIGRGDYIHRLVRLGSSFSYVETTHWRETTNSNGRVFKGGMPAEETPQILAEERPNKTWFDARKHARVSITPQFQMRRISLIFYM